MDKSIIIDEKLKQITTHMQLLSIKDVCSCLNIGHWMVYKLIGERKLGSITIGKRRLIPVQEVEKFIARSWDEANG